LVREFEKKDTIEVANIARCAFERNDAVGYYEQPGLAVLLDVFDTRTHSEQALYESLGTAEFFYVFEEQGKIVGFLRGSIERLRTLAVDPKHQGEGIGAKLVSKFEQWAKINGGRSIEIHAAVYSAEFYEKMGYVKQGEITEFEGLDIYNMNKTFEHKEKRMKQFTILIDGMADRAQAALNGKTPMEAASTPYLDTLYAKGRAGVVKTIPDGMEAGSAVANMSILGYDPAMVYKGRGVIEAAGAGIPVNEGDLYIRCNFVTLEGENFDDSVMSSYSAHGIKTHEAAQLTARLNEQVFGDKARLIHTGAFRNILVVKGAADLAEQLKFIPSHEIIGRRAGDYAKGEGAIGEFYGMMRKAYDVLSEDNETRANAIWFWGASYAPSFGEPSKQKRIVLGETILMRGIAALSGMDSKVTDESNGFVQFLKDKKDNAIAAVKDYDYAYIHIQKPDDLSHELMPREKAQALSDIDEYFVGPFFSELDALNVEYCGVIASDHFTFSDNGSHGAEPTPFIIVGHASSGNNDGEFTEKCCEQTGLSVSAPQLVDMQHGEC
jgi:2,3-bisphosphoglycerate-independent phosphoglycerate mutase